MPSATHLICDALKARGVSDEDVKAIRDNHDAEARELQELRETVPELQQALDRAGSAYQSLSQRVAALEARNADDDQLANEALAGFTGETEPTPPTDQSGADTTTEAEGQPPAGDQTDAVASGKGSK